MTALPKITPSVALPFFRFNISGNVMKTEHVCPKCQSKAIDRVPRQDILERLILRVRRRRLYRCLDCDHHFHDRPVSKT
jgi:DNA-directed RNA polymerase subunit RPC12/RpoP